MTELTADKWAELNTKLEAEAEAAQTTRVAAAGKAAKLALAAAVLLVIAAGVPIAFIQYWYAGVAAVPPALGFVLCIGLMLRHRSVVKQADADLERLRQDIRQWKKKRPTA